LLLTLKRIDYKYAAIDAVSVTSVASSEACKGCPSISYEVQRDGVTIGTVASRVFKDTTTTAGKVHQYKVRGLFGSNAGDWSPLLRFQAGAGFCGDGKLDSSEQCDDGNSVDGDGCSMDCVVERGYKCDKAIPNKCTRPCGDGICDPSEKVTCSLDCGFYNAEGSFNQWPATADYSADSVATTALIGEPLTAAAPCTSAKDAFMPRAEGLLTVTFKTAVPLSPSSALEVYLNHNSAKLTMELVDTEGRVHTLPDSPFFASCRHHPWRVLLGPKPPTKRELIEPRKSDPLPTSFDLSSNPVLIKSARIKFAVPEANFMVNWLGAEAPQVTAVRMVSSVALMQATCAIQGPDIVWSVGEEACASVKTQHQQTCPSAKPLRVLKSCVAAESCTSKTLAACRSTCMWGTVAATETTSTISLSTLGVSKEAFSSLHEAFRAAVAEAAQIASSELVQMVSEASEGAGLRVTFKVQMPSAEAAKEVVASAETLLGGSDFQQRFKAKALEAGRYIPGFRVTFKTPTPTPTPTPIATVTPEPTASAAFCKIGKEDEFGNCNCDDGYKCTGKGCTNDDWGFSYYSRWDQEQHPGTACTKVPAIAVSLDEVVPEVDWSKDQ